MNIDYETHKNTHGLLDDPLQRQLCGSISVALMQKKICGLYIWGSVGTGKTMIMDLTYKAFPKTKLREHFKPFMLCLHQTGFDQTLLNLKKIKLLCLDELEILDIVDAMIVKRLFEMLVKAGTKIITTSNTPPDDLYKKGLHFDRFKPFIEFVHEKFSVFPLNGPVDYRKRHQQGEFISFTKADTASILIDDQDLTVFKANNQIMVHFKDLFNMSFGPYHFVQLSKEFPILWIQDTPSFCAKNQDSLRQLITLVDVYYDQGLKVLLSPSPDIKFSEPLNQPISRLQSRLFEMHATSNAS